MQTVRTRAVATLSSAAMRAVTLLLLTTLLACGDNGTATGTATTGGSTGDASTSAATTDVATSTSTSTSTTTDDPTTTTSTSTTTSTTATSTAATSDATTEAGSSGGEPDEPVHDPAQDGPYTYDEITGEVQVGQAKVPVVVYYPTDGPAPGPYPTATFAHGFNIGPTQYTSYVKRLATHGYVAVNVDHRGYLGEPVDHFADAKQILAAIDWVAAHPLLKDVADTTRVGTAGHSLGGKISVLAAMIDPRVRTSLTFDPVDGTVMGCPGPQECPDVSGKLPIALPLGFLGQLTDGTCAPPAENYTTFYAAADPPALAVTIVGANHVAFLDDLAKCGISCAFCKAGTADPEVVGDLARAYLVAFFGRHLRGVAGYDAYLTGAEAQARYVDTGVATLESK